MPETLRCYILLFFTCSFLGWAMEVACKYVQFRRVINRGFLLGPYCPIYGFGAVAVCAALTRFAQDPLAVFALSMLICGTLEYLTSYAMEKLFHARWWDYSQRAFNLNGRVCANTLVPFGLLGLLLVYAVKPFLFARFARIPPRACTALCAALCALMFADAILSTTVLGKIRRTASLSHGDSTERITQAVRQELMARSFLIRRLLRAFPYARLYNAELLARLNAQRQKLREETRSREAALRAEFKCRERELRAQMDVLKAQRKAGKGEKKA